MSSSLWDARKTKVDRKCRQWPYILTYEGVEVLPALPQDSLSQAEITLHSVTEYLADRPTRPDKSGQEMHTVFASIAPILPEFVTVLLEFPQFLPSGLNGFNISFHNWLSVAFIKQFRCHKQELKTGRPARLRI